MRNIQQLGIILAFGFAGDIFAHFVPIGLPASVLGMLLMLAALGLKILKPEHIGETADFLGGIMAFFFLPAAVTVVQNFDIIKPVVWQIIVICVTATAFTFFVTYGTVRLLRIILERRNKS
jgi:holin-like protein